MTDPRPARGGRLLLEMISIVFAVVLGFAVTSWDAARKERARAERAVERISMELTENLEGLSAAVPYYGAMAQRLDSIMEASGDAPVRDVEIPGWRGLSPPSLRTASFQLASETGTLEHIEFDVADQLAVTYEVLASFSTSVDHALGTVMSGDLTTVGDWAPVFGLFAELSFAAEAQVREALRVLTKLENG